MFNLTHPCKRLEAGVCELRAAGHLQSAEVGAVLGQHQQRGVRQVRAARETEVAQGGAALGQLLHRLVSHALQQDGHMSLVQLHREEVLHCRL